MWLVAITFIDKPTDYVVRTAGEDFSGNTKAIYSKED